MNTKDIEVCAEVSLDEWTSEELIQELKERKKTVPIDVEDVEYLIRQGIEDRDWRKIEEFAEKLDIEFFRRK